MPPTVSVGSIIIKNDPVFRPESFLLNLAPQGMRGYSDAWFSDYKPQDRAEGNWWGCSFRVYGRENILKELYENALGRQIEVWGYGIECDFEARIYEVIFNYPPDKFIISLRSMSNSAHMRADVDDDGEVERSTTIQNTGSIGTYGQVDGVMSGGELASLAIADQTIQSYINLRGLPKPSAQFQQAKDEPFIEIFARGYVTSIEDRLYNQTALTGTQSLTSQVQDIIGTKVPLVSLLDDLKMYYSLDEASDGSGAVTRSDKSGNGMHLTDNNTTPSGSGKQYNGADFTAANSEYLSRASEAGLQPTGNDMSVACWVKFDSVASTADIVGKWSNTGQLQWILHFDSATPHFEFWVSNNGTATSHAAHTTTLTNGVWYFVYAFHDAVNNLVGVVLNASTTQITAAHSSGIFTTGTDPLTVGWRGTGTYKFDGIIDEIGIWDRVLTQKEIEALYNAGNGIIYNDFAGGEVLLEGVAEFVDSQDFNANTTSVSKEYDVDRKALGIVMDMVRLGDNGNNRWLFGMRGRDCTGAVGRIATLKQAAPVKPPEA